MAIQTNRPNNRTVLFVGIVLALLAGAGAFILVRNGSGGDQVQVVVAKQAIAAGTPITSDEVDIESRPQDSTPTDAFTDVNTVVNQELVNPVAQGVVIFPALVSNPTSVQTTSGSGVAITPGFVALSIPATETPAPLPGSAPVQQTGVSGDQLSAGYYIQPGDHIDIMVDNWNANGGAGAVHYAFQDVRVLKVGVAPGGAVTPTVYVIELPRAQAELMTYMITHTPVASPVPGSPLGSYATIIKYVLRPTTEWGQPNPTNDPKIHTYPYYESSCPPVTSSKGVTTVPATCPGVDPYANPAAGLTDGNVSAGTLSNLFGH